MKTPLAVAATLILSACAAVPGASPTPARVANGATSYCWQGRLVTEGDNMVCNWSSSAREACDNMSLSTMKKSAVASGPERVTMCGNGQWVVAVTTR